MNHDQVKSDFFESLAPGDQLLTLFDLIPEVSPDGRYALFSVIRSMNYVIKVVEIANGEMYIFLLMTQLRINSIKTKFHVRARKR